MNLEEQIKAVFSARNLTLATAESCTGGLVGDRITNVPGSSAYFLGGVISYANSAKIEVLGVAEETLITHGAVSHETVREMAVGAARLMHTDVAVSISGIAGPDGGTAEKPVGLVHFGLQVGERIYTTHRTFTGNRESIKAQAAEFTLTFILEKVELEDE